MAQVRSVRRQTDNPFLNMYELEAVKRDGTTFPYYMASRARDTSLLRMNDPSDVPDGIAVYGIMPGTPERVVLVRQYRYPLGGYVYELPAGLVERGEDLYEAAVREMREETGLTLTVREDPLHGRMYYSSVGMTDENASMVFGTVSGTVSTQGLEDTEDLSVVLADRDEAARILAEERVAIRCAMMLTHFISCEEDPFGFLKKIAAHRAGAAKEAAHE